MPNTATAPQRCPACGRQQPNGSRVESLRHQLREAKLGLLQQRGEIERLTALLREAGVQDLQQFDHYPQDHADYR